MSRARTSAARGLLLLAGAALLAGCASATTREWPAHGRDAGGMRHSPLTQIDRSNVKQLAPAWTYRTGELETYAGTRLGGKAAFEATVAELRHRIESLRFEGAA